MCRAEEFAARVRRERKKRRSEAAPTRYAFLSFHDSVCPHAWYDAVEQRSSVITGQNPLAVDKAFTGGWTDDNLLPGGLVDREMVFAEDEEGLPWPACVLDETKGGVPANVLAQKHGKKQRVLVLYLEDGMYGWVDPAKVERLESVSSHARHAIRKHCVHNKRWRKALELMKEELRSCGVNADELVA